MSAHTNITIAAEGRDATADIQQAIDTASAAGGGVVSLLAGRHVSGGLHLKSGVELHLAQDAVLAPISDYDAYAHTSVSVIAEDSDRGMIVAKGASNIAVTGPGRIEAGGENFIIGDDEAMGTYVPAKRGRVSWFWNPAATFALKTSSSAVHQCGPCTWSIAKI